MKNIILFLFLFLSMSLTAQKEGNVWAFGNNGGLDFNNTCELPFIETEMLTFETGASISNADGELLFYSNGGGREGFPGRIWNRNGDVMYEIPVGQGGGISSTQSAIIFPVPDDADKYYMFTVEEVEAQDFTPAGLSYFTIDMTLNGGLGEVTEVVETISPDAFETLTAYPRADGAGYWVFCDLGSTQALQIWSVTAEGVILAEEYDYASVLPPNSAGNSTFRVSPDGTRFFGGSILYDFDSTSGELTNPLFIQGIGLGATFSPDSRWLYTLETLNTLETKINRVDTEAINPNESIETVASINNTVGGQMQVGPDGNIWFVTINPLNLSTDIHALSCPNTDTPSLRDFLRNYPENPLVWIGLTNFTDNFFIDENLNTDLELCAESSGTTICEAGESQTLSATHYFAETYTWSNGATTESIEVTTPGTYTVTVTDGACAEGTATFEIVGGGETVFEITGETDICPGELLSLSVPMFTDIEWTTGENTSEITVSEAGIYGVTATDVCGDVVTAETEITALINELFVAFDIEGTLDCGGEIGVTVETNGSSFFWNIGDSTNTNNPTFFTEPGSYTVQTTDGCYILSESVELTASAANNVEVPNVFTPNNDDVNDTFSPVFFCDEVSDYNLEVYNRWGASVFQTTDTGVVWDGADSVADVYAWVLRVVFLDGERIERRGDLTLVR